MWVDGLETAIIYEDDEKQISLVAELVDREVVFMVENEGRLKHFSKYDDAVKNYIKLSITK